MNRTSKFSAALALAFSVLFVFCSQESRLENLQKRLDAFRNILPQELREKFDTGDYPDVAAGMDSLLSQDSPFKGEYEKLKDQEAINVFSTQEVVDFYREHFVKKIDRLKSTTR